MMIGVEGERWGKGEGLNGKGVWNPSPSLVGGEHTRGLSSCPPFSYFLFPFFQQDRGCFCFFFLLFVMGVVGGFLHPPLTLFFVLF